MSRGLNTTRTSSVAKGGFAFKPLIKAVSCVHRLSGQSGTLFRRRYKATSLIIDYFAYRGTCDRSLVCLFICLSVTFVVHCVQTAEDIDRIRFLRFLSHMTAPSISLPDRVKIWLTNFAQNGLWQKFGEEVTQSASDS